MTRNRMITIIRNAVKATGCPPSLLTVRLGLGAGTTEEEAWAVREEALREEADVKT